MELAQLMKKMMLFDFMVTAIKNPLNKSLIALSQLLERRNSNAPLIAFAGSHQIVKDVPTVPSPSSRCVSNIFFFDGRLNVNY
jgi:hypothetical protein